MTGVGSCWSEGNGLNARWIGLTLWFRSGGMGIQEPQKPPGTREARVGK